MATILNLDNVTDPNCPLAIYRGSDYRALTLFYPEDISTYTICGEIRDNYAHVTSNNLLTSFLFEPLVHGTVVLPDSSTIMATTIIPYLTSVETDVLEPTKTRSASDRIIPGRNAYVYDIKIKAPTGEEYPVVYGAVEVTPNVSECL